MEAPLGNDIPIVSSIEDMVLGGEENSVNSYRLDRSNSFTVSFHSSLSFTLHTGIALTLLCIVHRRRPGVQREEEVSSERGAGGGRGRIEKSNSYLSDGSFSRSFSIIGKT